ncbi:hypothetical protein DQ04_11511020 [Trypanosoma grayi]|uniref:hypothetical protein n=1 Tax=Trypanosoma grayi TaxID=71804 RepID=UPI0004F455D9|nr:hypothetical protein DQ04_11511020 [Trypanosoma grayi]KEG06953.1 hypothetical protein DQ04_11511020 [Trypanosoma grayi]
MSVRRRVLCVLTVALCCYCGCVAATSQKPVQLSSGVGRHHASAPGGLAHPAGSGAAVTAGGSGQDQPAPAAAGAEPNGKVAPAAKAAESARATADSASEAVSIATKAREAIEEAVKFAEEVKKNATVALEAATNEAKKDQKTNGECPALTLNPLTLTTVTPTNPGTSPSSAGVAQVPALEAAQEGAAVDPGCLPTEKMMGFVNETAAMVEKIEKAMDKTREATLELNNTVDEIQRTVKHANDAKVKSTAVMETVSAAQGAVKNAAAKAASARKQCEAAGAKCEAAAAKAQKAVSSAIKMAEDAKNSATLAAEKAGKALGTATEVAQAVAQVLKDGVQAATNAVAEADTKKQKPVQDAETAPRNEEDVETPRRGAAPIEIKKEMTPDERREELKKLPTDLTIKLKSEDVLAKLKLTADIATLVADSAKKVKEAAANTAVTVRLLTETREHALKAEQNMNAAQHNAEAAVTAEAEAAEAVVSATAKASSKEAAVSAAAESATAEAISEDAADAVQLSTTSTAGEAGAAKQGADATGLSGDLSGVNGVTPDALISTEPDGSGSPAWVRGPLLLLWLGVVASLAVC